MIYCDGNIKTVALLTQISVTLPLATAASIGANCTIRSAYH
jgi:hypothetical protein